MSTWNVIISKYFSYHKNYSTISSGPVFYYVNLIEGKEEAAIDGISKAREIHLSRGEFSPEDDKSDFELMKTIMEHKCIWQWNGPAGPLKIQLVEITEDLWS